MQWIKRIGVVVGKESAIVDVVCLVTMLFGAFGGFLLEMYPRSIEKTGFVHGYAAFGAVLLFFGVKLSGSFLLSRRPKTVVFAILFILGTSTFFYGGIVYRDMLDEGLFRYPNTEAGSLYLAGNELTENAQKAVCSREDLSSEDHLALVYEFTARPATNFEAVWTSEGLDEARREVFYCYLVVISGLVFALGCAVEALHQVVRKE